MKIIPVFDLRDGILVHALGGSRGDYQPMNTSLIPGPDPEKACAILCSLGFNHFYIADLNAITGQGNNSKLVSRMVKKFNIRVWLDSGIKKPEDLPLPGETAIVQVAGSETLERFGSLKDIIRKTGPENTILSLDTKNHKLISPDPELNGADPAKAAKLASCWGIRNFIVLDLSAVGMRTGISRDLLQKLASASDASFYPGGGIANMNDLIELKNMGMAGALVATALYSKSIDLKYCL